MSAATPANPAAAFYATPAARLVGASLRLAHRWSPAFATRLALQLFFTPLPGKQQARAKAVPAPWSATRHPLRRRRADHLAAPGRGLRPAARPAGPRLGRRCAAVAPARRPPGRGGIRSGARRPAGARPQRRRPQHPAAVGARPVRRELAHGTVARHRRAFARRPGLGARGGARPAREAAGAGRDLAAAAPVPALVRRRARPRRSAGGAHAGLDRATRRRADGAVRAGLARRAARRSRPCWSTTGTTAPPRSPAPSASPAPSPERGSSRRAASAIAGCWRMRACSTSSSSTCAAMPEARRRLRARGTPSCAPSRRRARA